MIEKIKELLKESGVDGRKASAIAKKIVQMIDGDPEDADPNCVYDCRPSAMKEDDRRTMAVVSRGEPNGEVKIKS